MTTTRRWWVFALVCLALSMGALDSLVVTTALPAIGRVLHALSDLEWTVNAYTLVFTICMIPAAAVGDRFGHRRVLLGEVALVTDYCPNWIRILVRRYNQDGPQVLADQRKQNTGALPLLSNGQKNQLRQLLEQAPPDGGLWTGPKVAHWMSGQIGRKFHAQRGWDYLKHLRFSLQIPRPRHHFDCLKPNLSITSSVCLTYSSPRHFFEILILTRLLRQLNHSCPPCTFCACCFFRN